VDGRGGAQLPPHHQQVVVDVGVRRRPAAAVARLDLHEGLEPAQRGSRLPPHRLSPDQRLQPHQTLERAQRAPSLGTVCFVSQPNHTARFSSLTTQRRTEDGRDVPGIRGTPTGSRRRPARAWEAAGPGCR
jgi:hypothetical protein